MEISELQDLCISVMEYFDFTRFTKIRDSARGLIHESTLCGENYVDAQT